MMMLDSTYALVTAARNEELFIEKLICSVIAQDLPPSKWIIVSDNSHDQTDSIVHSYSKRFDYIELVRASDSTAERSFGSHAKAFNFGCSLLDVSKYNFIGNLDADLTLPPYYYAQVINKFDSNSSLGIAGGQLLELTGGRWKPRSGNRQRCVAGALQLFRQKCFAQVGPYNERLWMGGYDSLAEILAKINGWQVESFPEIEAMHHRSTGSANWSSLRGRTCAGRTDYLLGKPVVYVIAKGIRRLAERPYILGGLAILYGYFHFAIKQVPPAVSGEVIQHLKAEQFSALRETIFHCKNKGLSRRGGTP